MNNLFWLIVAALIPVASLLFLAGVLPATIFLIVIMQWGFSISVWWLWSRRVLAPRNTTETADSRAFARKRAQSTWSPFQSPEVREICANLTPEEYDRILAAMKQGFEMPPKRVGANRRAGVVIGSFVAIVFGLAQGWGVLTPRQTIAIATVALMLYTGYAFWPHVSMMRSHMKEIMCETEWARKQGYKPETLRTKSLPWSKRLES